MKVGEWYTNPSSKAEYVIRITAINTESDQRDGDYKVFDYFHMGTSKQYGEKKNAMYVHLREFTKIKDVSKSKKLEEYYKSVSGPDETEQLDKFINGLDDLGGRGNGSN